MLRQDKELINTQAMLSYQQTNSFNVYSHPTFFEQNPLPFQYPFYPNSRPTYFPFDTRRDPNDFFPVKEELAPHFPFVPNQWLSDYYEPPAPNSLRQPETSPIAPLEQTPQPPQERQFVCAWNDCQLSFSTKTGLATHISSHIFQLFEAVPSESSRKRTKTTVKCQWRGCAESENEWSTYKMLAKHLSADTHVGQMPFLPKVEGNSEEESDQKRSRGAKSKRPKKYACGHPGCGKSFSDSSNRKKHERTHDANRERFHCTEPGCSKSYSTKTDLNIHIKVHKGEFPHKCTHPNCTKQFSRLSEKYAHERTHDNILPHVCEECGKRFREKSRLKKHATTHEKSNNNAAVSSPEN